MSISRRAMMVAGAAAAVPVLCSSKLFAQPVGDGPGGAGGPAGMMDAQLATWMLTDGFKQIEVSRPALEKAQDQAVKDFAQAEIKEHEDLKAKITGKGIRPLVPIGGGEGGRAGAAADRPDTPAQPAGGMAGGEGGERVAMAGRGGRGLLLIKNEIAQACVRNNLAEGGKKQGAEYDDFYVNDQLSAHMQLKDTVEVAMKHASPEMKPVLDEAMGTIENHIETLKGLKKKMMNAKA